MEIDPLKRNNVTVVGNLMATKTIIFVNGLGYDQSFWRYVTPSFASDYRLVLFDNVGSIQSNQVYFREKQSRYLNVSGYAKDLLEICADLNLCGDTIVVGHSLGAIAGLLASIQRPTIFSGLVLLGASPHYAESDDYSGGFSQEDITATYEAIQNSYNAWTKQMASVVMATPDRPSLVNNFAEALARTPREMMLTVLCSVLQMDCRSELAKVRVPTLIIQSCEDYFVPINVAEYMHTHIQNSKLTVINAHGHLPHMSAPEEIVSAISSFIK